MGDSGNTTEQVGYATASSPTGPWTKSSLNPVIPFGTNGVYDAGTVADPMVYKMNGTYYITYAASSTKLKPWIQAYATTDDFVTFKKQNIILGEGDDGAWDGNNAHRGAISRFGDYYYFSYTGHDGNVYYRMGLAKQYAKNTAQGFPPEQVFDFYDDFSSSTLGSHLRQQGGTGGTYSISNGILDINSGIGTQNRISSIQAFDASKGYMMEAKVQHPNADGTGKHSGRIGFSDKNFCFQGQANGKFNLGFGGNGRNYVDIKDSPSLGISNQITVEAWINPSSLYAATYQGIVAKRNTTGKEEANYALWAYGNQIKFGFNNGSWKMHTTTSANLQTNQWYHVAAIFDGTAHNVKIFVNGVKALDEAEAGSMLTDSNDVTIGYGNFTNQYFNGKIDEVRISNIIRYTTDFSVPTSSYSADGSTAGLWHFDENNGAFTDETSNHNDGSILPGTGIGIYDNTGSNWYKSSSSNNATISNTMSQSIDNNWHTQRIWWKSSGDVRYQNDNNPWEAVTTNIPTVPLNLFFMSSAAATYSTDLNIDWVKVRKYADIEPSTIVNEEAGYYSLGNPTIQPPTASGLDFTYISGFAETATKDGGEIKYVLSNDAGTNWIYYNGSSWVPSNGTYSQSNTAAEINSNISTFPIGGGKFLWRAFLHSNGVQQVKLSRVEVNSSEGSSFIPPTKPSTSTIDITTSNNTLSLTNLPTTITQIAISTSPDFPNSSWEDISQKDTLLNQYPNNTLYIKFRTQEGGVSDTITYTKDSTQTNTNITLQDGDLVKTPTNPDIYVIKYKNNKQYKRLLLSPTIFNSYLHLKWNNIKTISQQQLDQYQTSNLVKETTDTIIYTLTPNGDTGKRKPLNPSTSYDPDSIYEINKPERDSYELED
ncbi:MAG: hypothetical protein PHE26_12000 [Syntrophomonadaceae bacterium]|nr:hypothetical protein [Syntrophomonadaceae bacterium]